MRAADLVRLAFGQVRRGGVRSLLCGCTVAIGVCAISVIGAVGQVAQDEMHTAVHSLGLRGMTCYLEDAAAGEALTPAFAETVMDSCPDVQAAMPVKYQTGSYQNGFHSGSALLFGVNEQMGQVLDVELLAGRLFTAGEASGMVRRVVVSQSLAEQLYGRTNVTGQQLYLTVAGQEQIFEIIGVIRDQTQLLSGIAGSAVPTVIYLPYALLADANQAADQVLLSCTGDTETVKRQLSAVAQGPLGLRSTIGVQNLSGYLSTVDDLAQKAVWVFLLVAGISMVVALGAVAGGMLSAAHDMREEIGIYRAIGARQTDVFWLFLLQAAIICALGAACGIAFAQILCLLAAQWTGYPIAVSPGLTAGCFGVAVACGILSGIAPALHAAHLDPVKTMRG